MIARAGALVCTVASLAVACGGDDAGAIDDGAPLSSARYHLTWDTAGVELGADGGFTVVNDLDYRVTVARGYLVTYLVQLAPCDVAAPGLSETPGVAAYHGEEVDPSVAGNLVESLTWPADRVLAEVTFPRVEYCRVHYVVAPADGNTRSLPDDVGMEATSIYLEGTYRAPASETDVAFTVRGRDATAILESVAEVAGSVDQRSEHAEVIVARSLAGLLDGVGFRYEEADALQILFNLRHGAWTELSIGR